MVNRSIGVALLSFLHLSALSIPLGGVGAIVVVNEVAYKGSALECNGEDWIELFNNAAIEASLLNYTLHDDKGPADVDAKMFFADMVIAGGEYKVLCKDTDFNFGIGKSDSVTLLDGDGVVVSTSGVLPGTGGDDQTYSYFSGTNSYRYTTTPTPGAVNLYSEPEKTLEEELEEQNGLGKDFFRFDDDGTERKSSTFPTMVDIYVDMDAISLGEIENHPGKGVKVPFTQVRVHNSFNDTELANGGTGRIRTKGQSTLIIIACLGLKNIPFRLEFDTPLFGIEVAYLRNHAFESSYMREYAAHRLNARFGLPFLRVRPVRLYLNGEYTGLYSMMEAPDQGYVMQRSFGSFDPAVTALFKFKTNAYPCDFTDEAELAKAENRDVPDPYYFERGDHRDDIPILKDLTQCYFSYLAQFGKFRKDIVKGYVENNKNCSLAMVELGRIDRDFGPKQMEDAMISFLDANLNNEDKSGLKDAIDADQWIKNLAVYAVTLNFDSPINNFNNWYVATTTGGASDWRIVQWDHNNIATRTGAQLCGPQCGVRQIYWPIMRPTCQSVEDNVIVGSILNDDSSRQTYLKYVASFLELLSPAFFSELREYGNAIKDFVADDPLNPYASLKEYEELELGLDYESYNTQYAPFIKIMQARKEEVQKQLNRISAGTLPRNGSYAADEVCPDWRDSSGEDYLNPATYVESDKCPAFGCEQAADCYGLYCSESGDFIIPQCAAAVLFVCDGCYPYSHCGTNENDNSTIIKHTGCGEWNCSSSSYCFDHKSGHCAWDGELLSEECKDIAKACTVCFPHSRCGQPSEEASSGEDGSSEEEISSPKESSSSFSSTMAWINVLVSAVSLFVLM